MMFKSIFGALLFLSIALPPSTSIASNIRVEGVKIIISGVILDNDSSTFEKFVISHPNVTLVEFSECVGGLVREGYKIAESIRKRRLSTVIRGSCMSSCAYAFLAGVTRSVVADQGIHMLFLHLARNVENPKDPEMIKLNVVLARYIDFLTNGVIEPRLMDLIQRSTEANQGLAFLVKNDTNSRTIEVRYCSGTLMEFSRVNRCNLVPDTRSSFENLFGPIN
jgi:hypothetical protein